LFLRIFLKASQLNYLVTSDKGFNPVKKIVIPLNSETSMQSFEVIKQEFLSIPGVEKAGASSNIPGQDYTRNGYFPEGVEEPLMFHALDVDYDYIEMMGFQVVQGRKVFIGDNCLPFIFQLFYQCRILPV